MLFRSGIAITLVLLAFGMLQKSENLMIKKLQKKDIIWIFLIAISAVLVHLGVLVILICFILGFLISPSGNINYRRLIVVWSFSFVAAVCLVAFISFNNLGSVSDLTDSGIMERIYYDSDASVGMSKISLWAGYGLLSFWIFWTIKKSIRNSLITGRLAAILIVISGPITLGVLFSIYTFIIIKTPPFVTGEFVRMINILLGISLLFIAATTEKLSLVFIASVFLISYQLKSIVESIYIYTAVKVF